MACDPTTLADSAKCLECLNPDELDAIAVQLMCNWATSGNVLAGNFRVIETGEPRVIETGEPRVIE